MSMIPNPAMIDAKENSVLCGNNSKNLPVKNIRSVIRKLSVSIDLYTS
ncbi:MAG: hypothetical protein QXZ70_08110 [Candidatus Bathyarchaeia archaeon]